MSEHRQVSVKHPDGSYIPIDEDIALLIESLWSLGMATTLSCQEDRSGLLCVVFRSSRDVERFLTIVMRAAAGNAERERVQGRWVYCEGDCPEGWWVLKLLVRDESAVYVGNTAVAFAGPAKASVDVGVWFPVYDYEWVLEAMLDEIERRRTRRRA